jgi:ribose-phosphate pyrophosphokinase
MITFKAIDSSGSLIKSSLTPFTYPAGEAHTKVEDRRDVEETEIAILTASAESIHDDLFQLAMWADYISNYNEHSVRQRVRKVALIPYFPGARADRGAPFGLAVYANFLANLMLDQIVVFDPHSPVLSTFTYPTATVLTPAEVIQSAHLPHYDGVIAPDKGAVARASAVADVLGLPLYTAEKERNYQTGKLEGYTFNLPPRHEGTVHDGARLLVVDDICDGGGTFILLADAVRDTGLDVTLDLYVSHPVFSGTAPSSLLDRYAQIFTTNSYVYNERKVNSLDRDRINHINVTAAMLGKISAKVGA